ncbi:hypothetical protein ACF0H5_012628 [Mactra antiquata]
MEVVVYLDGYGTDGADIVLSLRLTGYPVPTIKLSGVEITDLKTVISKNKGDVMPPQTTSLAIESPQTDTKRRKSLMESVDDMTTKLDDYDTVLKCCKEIGNFNDFDSLEVVLVRQNAIKSLIDSMKKYPNSADIQLEACKSLLQQVKNSDASLHYVTANGGIDQLHINFKTFPSNIELILIILDIFGYFSYQDEWRAALTERVNPSDFLTTMARHECDVTVIEKCCIVIGNLVLSEDIARSMMYVGGVHSLISMMTKYNQNINILKNCCTALGTFASHDDTCQAVSEAGATCAVMSVMTSFPGNPTLLESCCWALASLSRSDCVCMELMCKDAFSILSKTMKSFPHELCIQEYGCWALCNLSVIGSRLDDEQCQTAMEILIDCITLFHHNVELLEHICYSINVLISLKATVHETVVRKDGVSKLIELMKTYEENVDIQMNGCKTIGNLAVNGNFRRFAEDMGSSEAIISCMLRFDKTPTIQNTGCMALTNLSADVPDNKYRILKNGGVHAVLVAMTTFREDEQIQLNALKVLCNLIESDKGCWWITEESGIQIISMTLKSFSYSSDILAFGCTCLANLPRRGVNVIATENVESTLLYLRLLLSTNSEIAKAVCTFYENILKVGNDCKKLFNNKAMEMVVTIVNDFSDTDVKISGLKVFAQVAMGEDLNLMTRDVGFTLISTMEKNIEDYDVIMICCGIISYLSNTEKGLETIEELCCIDVILQAMRNHLADPEIHTLCLLSLENLCREGLVRGKTTQRVCDAVAVSMKSHCNNSDIQTGGQQILTIIGCGFHKENEQRRQSVDFLQARISNIKRKSVTDDIIEVASAALQRIKNFTDDVLEDKDHQTDKEDKIYIEMTSHARPVSASPMHASLVEENTDISEISE